ncbi:Fatty acid desaturase [Rhodoferax sp. OV413]|uniref:fatty acid desaturase n=1 Tax=Rhodoferax sp. OV413 TaxID=1855285 RepID=UPI00088A31DC|nr:fatty acid desaturase [Rhodoferax sp. OV413]SDO26544.1 Fatty acid desaturase [Rhodoferax sp. OV413]
MHSSSTLARSRFEWPTWLLTAGIYLAWVAVVVYWQQLGDVLGSAALLLVVCWYMSLQHELVHGHPTASPRINRLLGLAPLAVWYPFDMYRHSHLIHHQDEHLTRPGIDPESNYLTAAQYAGLPAWQRVCWRWQRTVLGRLLVGPALAIVPTWADILRQPLRGDWSHSRSWAEHLGLLALLLWALQHYAGIHPLHYLLVSYPALGLAMLRSLYEHRPALRPAHRIAINEASPFWRLLYLNNNYHVVHHETPSMPWYRLRASYLADRSGYLQRNGGFLVPGYGHLLRRFALTPIDSPVLPEELIPVARSSLH